MKLELDESPTETLKVGKVIVNEYSLSKEDILKMIDIITDLAETNSYELPYRGETLISRAIALLGKSRR